MKEEEIDNKGMKPPENKSAGGKVRIKLRPGRAMTGVTADANGVAEVDAKTAEHLIQTGYATREE